MMTIMATLLLIGCSSFTATSAFQIMISSSSSSSTQYRRSKSSLHMAKKTGGGAPRFDKSTEKWIVTDPDVSAHLCGVGLPI